MRMPYNAREILALRTLRGLYGHLTYISASQLEGEFYLLSGRWRASGALYMASWRDEQGLYDHLFF